MLDLGAQAGAHVGEPVAGCSAAGGANAAEVELLDGDVTGELEPPCLLHHLGEEQLGADPLGDRLVVDHGEELLGRTRPSGCEGPCGVGAARGRVGRGHGGDQDVPGGCRGDHDRAQGLGRGGYAVDVAGVGPPVQDPAVEVAGPRPAAGKAGPLPLDLDGSRGHGPRGAQPVPGAVAGQPAGDHSAGDGVQVVPRS